MVLSTNLIAGNLKLTMLLLVLVSINIGSLSAFTPLSNLVKVPSVCGIAQLNSSVSVLPVHAFATVCMLAVVPIASWNSVLVAKSKAEV